MVVRYRQTNKLPPALKHGVYSGMTLLPGEDLATYDDFLGRVYAAVKPVDIIDEIFIDDVASLEWEILRWRRLKSSLMRACALKALEQFLSGHLDYDQYWKFFEERLTEILRENLADQTEDDARRRRTNVPEMTRTLTTRSIGFSPASIWT
jgi:hypothetical protein